MRPSLYSLFLPFYFIFLLLFVYICRISFSELDKFEFVNKKKLVAITNLNGFFFIKSFTTKQNSLDFYFVFLEYFTTSELFSAWVNYGSAFQKCF